MTTFVAEARARAGEPEALILRFREHMTEHGMAVTGPVAASRVAFRGGVASLRLDGAAIALRIEASSIDALAEARTVVAGHLASFVPGEALGIAWTGDGAEARPHNFRALTVTAVRDVTPRMRRVTLAGDRLARFDAEAIHVKILVPHPGLAPGREPAWPGVSAAGQPLIDPAQLSRRTYTIRGIDAAAGTLSLDFVLHGEGSPGSRFAARARPGDRLGIMGPGGATPPAAGWTLLAGDETAIPAIARGMERMPPDARGVVILEVADAAERQPLRHPEGIDLRWTIRDGAPYGTALMDAVRAVRPPADGDVCLWAACENTAACAIREHWGTDPALAHARRRAIAYWRQDVAEDGRR